VFCGVIISFNIYILALTLLVHAADERKEIASSQRLEQHS
jgi:hypothetical protein